MEIKRPFFLNELIIRKGNGLIKVVTGIRRSGKSYLVFNQFKKHLIDTGVKKDHIFEMAFDTKDNEKYRDSDVFYDYVKDFIKDDEKEYYVLLDEIQLLEDFESVLNGLIRMPNVDVYVTGSNAYLLSRDIITEFRGRGDEIYLSPLSFAEFMSVYKGDRYSGWLEYITYGGLPSVVLAGSEKLKVDLLNGLLEETYISDILQRHNIRFAPELEELLDLLASSIGSLTNPRKLSDTFNSVKNVKIGSDTLQKYIGYFEEAFMISSSKRYDIKGKKYINTPKKYYFSDMGLRNARLNFRQMEETHIMENIIYNELRTRGYGVDVGVVEYNTSDKNRKKIRKQLEVDFVCNRGSKRYYIQSAYAIPDEEKRKQEEASLTRIGDSFKKIIIVKDGISNWYTEEGIFVINIFDFLMDPDSLDKN